MGHHSVSLSRKAANYLKRCDAPARDRLREKIEKLKADPFAPQNSKPLKSRNGQRSARVGDLRILFQVQGLDIIVVEIGLVAKSTSTGSNRTRPPIVRTEKEESNMLLPVPVGLIERRIHLIRGQKVMLDADLAELYQVDTRALNQAVRRNRDRFAEDFVFQLTAEEAFALTARG
jgi:mRNA-degrading endonuclease RelE of RelBE toxin-antitoxin system